MITAKEARNISSEREAVIDREKLDAFLVVVNKKILAATQNGKYSITIDSIPCSFKLFKEKMESLGYHALHRADHNDSWYEINWHVLAD